MEMGQVNSGESAHTLENKITTPELTCSAPNCQLRSQEVQYKQRPLRIGALSLTLQQTTAKHAVTCVRCDDGGDVQLQQTSVQGFSDLLTAEPKIHILDMFHNYYLTCGCTFHLPV
jgi:hypothetical protein